MKWLRGSYLTTAGLTTENEAALTIITRSFLSKVGGGGGPPTSTAYSMCNTLTSNNGSQRFSGPRRFRHTLLEYFIIYVLRTETKVAEINIEHWANSSSEHFFVFFTHRDRLDFEVLFKRVSNKAVYTVHGNFDPENSRVHTFIRYPRVGT